MENLLKEIYNSGTKKTFKDTYINEVEDGANVCITGKLHVLEKEAKSNKYYLLTFNDKHGIVTSAIWSTSPLYSLIEGELEGKKVSVSGTIKKNGTFTNIEIEKLSIVETDDIEVPDVKDLQDELNKRVSTITNTLLKKIVVRAIKDNSDDIVNAPFSEKTAYAYKGGLLHFTVDLCDLVHNTVDSINCGFWNGSTILNEDMLTAGAILSNLGKSKTLRITNIGTVEKTPLGIMEEDSAISRDIAKQAIDNEFTELRKSSKKPIDENMLNTLSMELLHMISSVKANQSWGAISSPRSKNAMILSNLNAIAYTKGLFEGIEKENDSNTFVKAYDNGKTYYIDEKLE